MPDHLNVDASKNDENIRFADRTASHIKNGLLEVHLEPTLKQTEIIKRKEKLRKRMSKEERKLVFAQLMSVQGSYAKRKQAKANERKIEINRLIEEQQFKL